MLVKESGRVSGKNVTSLTVSHPSGRPNDRYNVMKRGLVVRVVRQSSPPDLLTIIFIFYPHFLRACPDQCRDGGNEAAPPSDRAIHLRIVAACVWLAKLYGPRIPLAYRYYLFAVELLLRSRFRRAGG